MTGTQLDPAFEARLWEFINDVRDGTAADCSDAFAIARWLVGCWEVALVEGHMRITGVDRGESEVAIDEFIRSQATLTGVMATTAVADG